jgi:hypothetical protein
MGTINTDRCGIDLHNIYNQLSRFTEDYMQIRRKVAIILRTVSGLG